jgi:integrase
LHRILEEAVENGEIASNPAAARGTRVKPSQPKKARNLTPDEVGRLLSAAGQVAGPSDALAIEVMFVLGLRIGEMAGLQARDVDLQRREITIQRTVSDTGGVLRVQDATKTNRYRVLPVAAELPVWGRLVEHIRQRGLIAKAHVFQARLGGPIRPNNWRRRVWDKAMESAKILEPPTPHSGRRTAASLLSAAGVPPATVQAILGLSTLKQTGEYIDVPRKEMEAGLRKLVSLYGKD